jgi:hypothetical protein
MVYLTASFILVVVIDLQTSLAIISTELQLQTSDCEITKGITRRA